MHFGECYLSLPSHYIPCVIYIRQTLTGFLVDCSQLVKMIHFASPIIVYSCFSVATWNRFPLP